jgi:superfamily II DNA or RNA helicase
MIPTLRPHQARAMGEMRVAARAGKRGVLVVMPTGGGKTCLAAHAVASHIAKGGRVVWFAHRRELVRQAADTLRAFELPVGADGLNASAPVQVLSVQGSLMKGEVPPGSLCVFDEAHHFAGDQWKTLMHAYPDSIRLGLTATPERKDGRGLGAAGLFDHLVTAAQISELVAAGFLVPCEVRGPARKLKTGQLAQSPVDAYRKHAAGSRAVVFCHSVKASHDAAETFREAGFAAAAIDGTTEGDFRDDILKRFASGRLDVVCNMQVLTEGWDCPPAETCILARGCGSVGLYLQMVGRVLRAHPGKSRALLLDLRGVVHAQGFGMPDEDREYALDGAGIRRKGIAGGDRYCPVCKALVSGEWCDGCGTQLRDREGVELMGLELEQLTLPQRMAHVPEDKRVQMLARFIRGATVKGHKPAAALYKFRGTFGFMPPRAVIEAARAHLAAEDERRKAAGR